MKIQLTPARTSGGYHVTVDGRSLCGEQFRGGVVTDADTIVEYDRKHLVCRSCQRSARYASVLAIARA